MAPSDGGNRFRAGQLDVGSDGDAPGWVRARAPQIHPGGLTKPPGLTLPIPVLRRDSHPAQTGDEGTIGPEGATAAFRAVLHINHSSDRARRRCGTKGFAGFEGQQWIIWLGLPDQVEPFFMPTIAELALEEIALRFSRLPLEEVATIRTRSLDHPGEIQTALCRVLVGLVGVHLRLPPYAMRWSTACRTCHRSNGFVRQASAPALLSAGMKCG